MDARGCQSVKQHWQCVYFTSRLGSVDNVPVIWTLYETLPKYMYRSVDYYFSQHPSTPFWYIKEIFQSELISLIQSLFCITVNYTVNTLWPLCDYSVTTLQQYIILEEFLDFYISARFQGSAFLFRTVTTSFQVWIFIL